MGAHRGRAPRLPRRVAVHLAARCSTPPSTTTRSSRRATRPGTPRVCACCACAPAPATSTARTPSPGSTSGSGRRCSSAGPRRTAARQQARPAFLAPVLADVGLPAALADALEDTAADAVVQAETDEALALTGRDVGTPILQFRPPEGTAFFGPVISRLPDEEEAVAAVGPRHRPRRLPGLRRAQAEPARAAPAALVRRAARRGGRAGGLARRQPPSAPLSEAADTAGDDGADDTPPVTRAAGVTAPPDALSTRASRGFVDKPPPPGRGHRPPFRALATIR